MTQRTDDRIQRATNWALRRLVIGPLIRARVSADVTGQHYIPHGAAVLAFGSHTSEAESLIIPSYLGRWRIHFYAKEEYWHKGGFLRWFMDATGQIPVNRRDARAARAVVDRGVELLLRGEKIAIYPEGTRSPDGKLHGGHTGVARAVIGAIRAGMNPGDVPIIPGGLMGMELTSPTGSGFIPKPARVSIAIGAPIYVTDSEAEQITASKRHDTAIVRRLTLAMMLSIATLCGKEYDPVVLPLPNH